MTLFALSRANPLRRIWNVLTNRRLLARNSEARRPKRAVEQASMSVPTRRRHAAFLELP